jgi:pimeloyl-ACP methyl ester carboxylesterase
MQQLASSAISDPHWAALLLAMYAELDAGSAQIASAVIQRFHTPGEPITLRAMPTAMDLASGISDSDLAAFQRQARDGLVGAYLNFPMPQIRGAWDRFDLGDAFRQPPTGDTPVLLLTGTLDGRTYPEGQSAAVAGLSNVTQVTVHNAGHNLFMSSPEVHDTMHRFMRGEAITDREITVELPDFTRLPF